MDIRYQENGLYCCDNLELLRKIPDKSIDLIYCDVLYGTGKKFKDYIDIKSDEKIVRDFYITRLNLMRNKLKDTGSIYIQVDTHINYLMRAMMNEIFGDKNFRNEIIWWKNTFSQNTEELYLKKHDNILFYTKSKEFYFEPQLIYNGKKLDRMAKGFFDTGDCYLVYDEAKFNTFKDIQQLRGKYQEKPIKTKYDELPFTMCQDVIADISVVNPKAKEKVDYYSQKPIELMERFILCSSREGDLVADFFMGSGSFIVAAAKLKRKYIGCDNNYKAIKIARARLEELREE